MLNLYKYTILTQKWKTRLDDWAEDNRGAAAVEFALIAAPFFFLLFGLMEISMIFFFSATLEHGINEASRLIRTGNFQGQGLSQAEFKNAVCDELFDLLDCEGNLSIDVETFSSFGSSANNSPIEDGEFDSSNFGFSPGGPDEIVLVRVFYEWDLITPVMSAPLENIGGGQRLLQASIAFRNEPFGNNQAPEENNNNNNNN